MAEQTRYFRYLILLLILLAITGRDLYFQLKIASWQDPVSVKIYPLNGDDSTNTQRYINSISTKTFANIASFINQQALQYGVSDKPVITIELATQVTSSPPELPDTASIPGNIFWSLSFRWWSFLELMKKADTSADINLFIKFYDPAEFKLVEYSVGLKKSMTGLINAYADQHYQGSNNVITTHELMHILGATDKYHPHTDIPVFPEGFAEPEKIPLYPQHLAEIMGGRIPLSRHKARIPDGLSQVVIGRLTAQEIHWID